MGVHSDVWLGSLVLRARSNRIDLLRFGTQVQLPSMWALHDLFFEHNETLPINFLGYRKHLISEPSPEVYSRRRAPSLESSVGAALSRPHLESENVSGIRFLNLLEEFGHLINSCTHFSGCDVQFGHKFPTRCICIPAPNSFRGL